MTVVWRPRALSLPGQVSLLLGESEREAASQGLSLASAREDRLLVLEVGADEADRQPWLVGQTAAGEAVT
jgi:hypothetical protein